MMTETQATDALFAAIQEDNGRTGWGDTAQPETPAPAETATEEQAAPAEPVTPEGDVLDQPAEPESFTRIDPDQLPADLQAVYRSMQADYTRKTQEIADQRKQFDSFGDTEQVRVATELFQSLQTPEGLTTFHQLLSDSLGLQPGSPEAMRATEQAMQSQQVAPVPTYEDDPEAALKHELDQVRGELQTMQQQWQTDKRQAQAEQTYYALAGELQRQSSLIQESNPHYGDNEMNAIYELASFHGGDLMAAQSRYEEIVSHRVADLISSKQATLAHTGIQSPGASGHAEASPRFETVDDAHRAAVEYVRQIEQQGV